MSLKVNVPALEVFMIKKNWSERDLAKHMGVSYTTVYRVLRGQRGVGNSFIAKLLSVAEGEMTFEDLFLHDKVLPIVNDDKENTA